MVYQQSWSFHFLQLYSPSSPCSVCLILVKSHSMLMIFIFFLSYYRAKTFVLATKLLVGLKYLFLSIFKLHKSISLPLPPCFKKKKKQILDLLLFRQTTYKRADFCYRHTGHNILLPSSYLSYSINQFCHQSVQEMWAFCDLSQVWRGASKDKSKIQ